MKCPYCGHEEQKVLDSRPAREGAAIRRRRECEACARRFTTFEEPERPRLLVVKRDGLREEFDREKVLNSMVIACRKRPVSMPSLRASVETVERAMFDRYDQEARSTDIGDLVMEQLATLDAVAFVRFASVYKEFDCPEQFAEIVSRLRPVPRAKVKARA